MGDLQDEVGKLLMVPSFSRMVEATSSPLSLKVEVSLPWEEERGAFEVIFLFCKEGEM